MIFKKATSVNDEIDKCKIEVTRMDNRINEITKLAADLLVGNNFDNPDKEKIIENIRNSLNEQIIDIKNMKDKIDAMLDVNHPLNVARRQREENERKIVHQQKVLDFQEDCSRITDVQYLNWLNKHIPWFKKLFRNIELIKVELDDKDICQNLYYKIGKNKVEIMVVRRYDLKDI